MRCPVWKLSDERTVPLDRPRFIAILNLTPDSFFDGGTIGSVEAAVAAARKAVGEGADVLDIGGESTRPGAAAVTVDEQVRRVIPAIEAIRAALPTPISIDTTSAEVARCALAAGANAINDTSAGRDDPEMLPLAGRTGCGLILMHRLKRPAEDSYSDSYKSAPKYSNVVREVRGFLAERARAAIAAGVHVESIVIDPGLGFGKTVEQNLKLIRQTGKLARLGFPVLSALSRKSFVGRVSGLEESNPGERLAGTLALTVAHHGAGARLFRVHDVGANSQALRAAMAAGLPR